MPTGLGVRARQRRFPTGPRPLRHLPAPLVGSSGNPAGPAHCSWTTVSWANAGGVRKITTTVKMQTRSVLVFMELFHNGSQNAGRDPKHDRAKHGVDSYHECL